jgi:hypothetical protein
MISPLFRKFAHLITQYFPKYNSLHFSSSYIFEGLAQSGGAKKSWVGSAMGPISFLELGAD